MLKYIGVLFLGLVLVGNTAYAQVGDPVALIAGPSEVKIGRTAWLQTLGSYGDDFNDFKWQIIPPEASVDFKVLQVKVGEDEEGKPIHHEVGYFNSTKPGTYYFILVATKDNKSVMAIHKLVNGDGIPEPGPDPDPSPDPQPHPIEIPTPSPVMKEVVKGVTELIVGEKAYVDGQELAMFYMDLADIIERDGEKQTIEDTAKFRLLHVRAGNFMFQKTGMDGRYQNLGQEVNSVLEKQIGLKIVLLDEQKRHDIVEVLEALAWAALEASKKAQK